MPTEPEEAKQPETDPQETRPEKVRELTPEERELLRQKIEQAKKDDPNIYPVF